MTTKRSLNFWLLSMLMLSCSSPLHRENETTQCSCDAAEKWVENYVSERLRNPSTAAFDISGIGECDSTSMILGSVQGINELGSMLQEKVSFTLVCANDTFSLYRGRVGDFDFAAYERDRASAATTFDSVAALPQARDLRIAELYVDLMEQCQAVLTKQPPSNSILKRY